MIGRAAPRGAIFWVAALATLALLILIVVGAFWSNPTGTLTPSVFSRAATGHAALQAILEELNRPVVVSRLNSVGKAQSSGGVLVLAEPDLDRVSSTNARFSGWGDLVRALGEDGRALLVLPKRQTLQVHSDNRQWQQVVEPANLDRLANAARTSLTLELTRVPVEGAVAADAETHGLELRGPVQLFRGEAIRPIVTLGDGVLFGETTTHAGARLFLLSDPDLIANAGIVRAGNAAFVVGLLDMARSGGPIIFDETIHGFTEEPGLIELSLQFPFVLVPITLGIFALTLIAAAASGRVGKVLAPPAPLKAGRRVLISAAADMLAQGHHDRFLLTRYGRLVRRRLAQDLSPSRRADDGAASALPDARLTELARRRGVAADPARMFHEAEDGAERDILRAACDLFDFKERMIRGGAARPGSGDRARSA